VQAHAAGDHARRRQAHAPVFDRGDSGFFDLGMIAQPEIIARGEVEHRLLADGDERALRRIEQRLATQQTRVLEVAQLAAQKRDLTRRLAASSSLDALARAARQLGYVKPGERLYIVKGIAAWLRAHSK